MKTPIKSNHESNIQPKDPECWKKIGVWSRRKSCPRLTQVIHCRNCEVFIHAGRKLLDQPAPPGYSQEWADLMAAKKEEALYTTLSLVIFRIETEWLAVRTSVFAEIINPDRLKQHTLPHRKNQVLTGIINVRGEILLLVSIRALLGIEPTGEGAHTKNSTSKTETTSYHRMLVIDSEDGKWAFPVDEILGVHRIHPNTFQNVPVTVAKANSTFTKGIFQWKERYVAFLDDELLIYSLTRSVQ